MLLSLLLRSMHPGPTVVVTLAVVGLGLATGLEVWRLAVLGATVFLGQASVGISNDAIDAGRDRAVGRTDKPLAASGAPLRAAWTAAAGTAVASVLLSGILGLPFALAHAVFLLSGWAYNLVLKRTVLSVITFMVGFGAVPALAPLALREPHLAPGWALAAGAALGIAIHCTNALPDFDDDQRTGIQGFPHRVGYRWSVLLSCSSLVIGAFLVASVPVRTGFFEILSWGIFGVVVAVAAAGLLTSLRRGATRLGFQLVMLGGLCLVAQLVFSGGFG